MEIGLLKFQLKHKKVTFNVFQYMKQQKDMCVVSIFNTVKVYSLIVFIWSRLGVEALEVIIMDFKGDDIDKFDEMVSTLAGMGSNTFALENIDLDMKSRETLSAKPSIEDPSIFELKSLPSYLFYNLLGSNTTLQIIIVVIECKVEAFVVVME